MLKASARRGARCAASIITASPALTSLQLDTWSQVDVVVEGWRLFDRENKGHIDASDMRRVCSEMGYNVTDKVR